MPTPERSGGLGRPKSIRTTLWHGLQTRLASSCAATGGASTAAVARFVWRSHDAFGYTVGFEFLGILGHAHRYPVDSATVADRCSGAAKAKHRDRCGTFASVGGAAEG
jgi:hypothetical protein